MSACVCEGVSMSIYRACCSCAAGPQPISTNSDRLSHISYQMSKKTFPLLSEMLTHIHTRQTYEQKQTTRARTGRDAGDESVWAVPAVTGQPLTVNQTLTTALPAALCIILRSPLCFAQLRRFSFTYTTTKPNLSLQSANRRVQRYDVYYFPLHRVATVF